MCTGPFGFGNVRLCSSVMSNSPRSLYSHFRAESGGASEMHSPARLDASFAALSDATRRGVLEQLGRADASITELAEKFHMTLTGMKKHVGVLEQAGLVTTEKVGRVRTCKLGAAPVGGRDGMDREVPPALGRHASTSWTRLSRS